MMQISEQILSELNIELKSLNEKLSVVFFDYANVLCLFDGTNLKNIPNSIEIKAADIYHFHLNGEFKINENELKEFFKLRYKN